MLAGCTTTTAPPPGAAAGPQPAAAPAVPAPGGLADVVARVEPSVVTIRIGEGVGSGVVYKSDIVLTNQHVVDSVAAGAGVTVDYADGTTSAGTVVASDATTDLAVVRTARSGLPVPEYRTDLPRPGDTVLAIGSPLGLENTVTAGIVSAVGRQVPGSAAQGRPLVDLIQVDAPISPGNSGGALLDANGRVIGINEAYLPPETGAVSLGFAIPAATAVDVADQLLANGTARHPYLGVSLAGLTPQIRQSLGVAVDRGALVIDLDPQGPAAAAGIRRGDVIVSLAGRDVGSVEDLLGALRGTEPGAQVPAVVARGNDRATVTVTIGTTGDR